MLPKDKTFKVLRAGPGFYVVCLLSLTLLFSSVTASEAESPSADPIGAHHGDGGFNAGDVIIGHMLDAYDWHLFDIGTHSISIPLPVILLYEGRMHVFLSNKFEHGHASFKGFRIATDGPSKGRVIRVLGDGISPDPKASFLLDLSITKNVFAIFFASGLLCVIFIRAAKSYRKVSGSNLPSRAGSLLEPVVIFIRDQIALGAIGPKHHERFLPYLLTLFFFIFFNNLLGLIPIFPGGANITGNISVTLVLALFTFFTTQIFANKGYWRHIFNTPGVPFWLKFPIPLMPVIELVGVVIKPFVLMIRLFANIMAGHMILLGFVSLIFILGNLNHYLGFGIAPLSVLFLIFMNFLELLVAFIQAYVFTLFSALFFGQAVPDEHH